MNGRSSSCGTTWLTSPHVSAVARVEEVPGRAELAGAPHADGLDEQDREPPARHDADPRVRVGETRPLGRNSRSQFSASSKPPVMHGPLIAPMRSLVRGGNGPRKSRTCRTRRGGTGRRAHRRRRRRRSGGRRELLEVGAGAERGIRARQDHDVDAVVGVDLPIGAREPEAERAVDRVAGLGPVQRDRRDTLRHVDEDRVRAVTPPWATQPRRVLGEHAAFSASVRSSRSAMCRTVSGNSASQCG